MNFIKTFSSITKATSLEGFTQSVFKRGFFIRGKNTSEIIDPNAPTTYPIKQIFCFDRVVKGKAGAKRVRHAEFIPATITGGGLPLKNIQIEWGRIKGLLTTGKLYKNRKFLLNLDDKEQLIGKLAVAQFHPLSEQVLFLKFSRSTEDPKTFTSELLPHLQYKQRQENEIQNKRDEALRYKKLQSIDLSFKPAVRKSELNN
ncbi:hypothetical protein DICPUDRAFT_41299 [Dictyostelium purpureum]|uniref:Large ribosomal subunit protein bL25 L25 domain-containing protein n=1 Tax=Dictyostelium purpureum TaxID=5786 RepID=F0ZZR2_DICPU|nr:uncharacterized protein DICPUDRAFT_41299 [Dictyostelium purpureum]EGC30563.1 hypothetical protein DICPUDRAFT_41299 [Dictyostelium purpureum]|eukprot:XP_003292904.1 hypothetical protein DICPUDRAFT_41299 [Dictyostelium purpureum]